MLKLVSGATALPITIAEAKAHAIVDFCDDDAIISTYIQAASSYLSGSSGILGYPLMAETYTLSVANFGELCLPFPAYVGGVELTTIQSIEYYDENNALQTLTGWFYTDEISFPTGFTFPQLYDRPDAVQVNFTSGFTECPASLKVAGLQLIAHWYENRAAVNITDRNASRPVPLTFNAQIAPFRRVGV